MAQLKIEVDASEATKELDRLIKGPSAATYADFEGIFIEVFARVEEDVHIETGSLFSTGRVETIMVDKFKWEGTIHYGGAAPGQINDPAYYGVYELARGGDHFFFQAAYDTIPHDMVFSIIEFYASGEKS